MSSRKIKKEETPSVSTGYNDIDDEYYKSLYSIGPVLVRKKPIGDPRPDEASAVEHDVPFENEPLAPEFARVAAARKLNDLAQYLSLDRLENLVQVAELISRGDPLPAEPKLLPQMPDEQRLATPSVYWQDKLDHPKLARLTAPEFILAVFGQDGDGRLGLGFTQADLKKVDEKLYLAFQRFPSEKIPSGLQLPTLEEWNMMQLELLGLAQLLRQPTMRKWISVAAGRAQRLAASAELGPSIT